MASTICTLTRTFGDRMFTYMYIFNGGKHERFRRLPIFKRMAGEPRLLKVLKKYLVSDKFGTSIFFLSFANTIATHKKHHCAASFLATIR